MNEPKKDNENSMEDIFGPVIYAYTRAQAIEDGVLVDLSETAREAGIRIPTAITAAAHGRYVVVPEELKGLQDEAGRAWDIVWMAAVAIRSGKLDGNEGLNCWLRRQRAPTGNRMKSATARTCAW